MRSRIDMRPHDVGYVTLQFQAGGCIVESSGIKRMFEAGNDLAEHLTSILKKPLNISVTYSVDTK